MQEDLTIFFNVSEHAVTADYFPQSGDAVNGITVLLEEGEFNDSSRDGELVSDNAVIDIMRSDVSNPEAGDEIVTGSDTWIVTGQAGSDSSVASVRAQKRRRFSYA